MKKLFLLLLLLGSIHTARAQSIPNPLGTTGCTGGTILQDLKWSTAQWITAWQCKADVFNPVFSGSIMLNGIPVPSYPQTPVELAAGVTPVNYAYPPAYAWRYGADPTGVTDSTAAMVRAHSTGYRIYYPAGIYKVAAGTTIPIPCGGIVGDGPNLTFFNVTYVGSANVFAYSCQFAGDFENFGIESASMTGGYALTVTAPTGENTYTQVRNVFIGGPPNGISFIAASHWTVTSVGIFNVTGDGITVNNTNNADSGDSSITNCNFAGLSITATGVHQIESGGLKILGNKFNGYNIQILLDLGLVSTSDLVVVGNSFENANTAAIKLQRTSGSATFANVMIGNNQFLVNSATLASSGIFSVPTSAFLSNVTVSGNTMPVNDTGSAASGISFDFASNVVINGNTLTGNSGSSTGIFIGSHGTNNSVTTNSVTGFGTNYAGTTGSQQLPVTTVATLPTCAAVSKGVLYAVSDATSPTYNAALTGGGTVSIPVYCNGSAWLAH